MFKATYVINPTPNAKFKVSCMIDSDVVDEKEFFEQAEALNYGEEFLLEEESYYAPRP